MSPKKKQARTGPGGQASKRTQRRSTRSSPAIAIDRRLYDLLSDLPESMDIMLPELTARIAALEHLLIEKQVCSREDLIRSREFVDIRRSEQ